MASGKWRPFCLGLNVLTFINLYWLLFTFYYTLSVLNPVDPLHAWVWMLRIKTLYDMQLMYLQILESPSCDHDQFENNKGMDIFI